MVDRHLVHHHHPNYLIYIASRDLYNRRMAFHAQEETAELPARNILAGRLSALEYGLYYAGVWY